MLLGCFFFGCKVTAHDGLHLISELQVSSLVDKYCTDALSLHLLFEYPHTLACIHICISFGAKLLHMMVYT